MNLDNITPQGYILAMIIRDDGERILLGDGAYVFKDSQQHFQPNTFANDVVELQGTDGQLLAGQVRRTAIQTFAGYIGDASTSQQRVEQYRKQFLMFFRKKFHYTAVYIFHDGSAIQRKRGYIATAPAVPELYQKYPEWSVGLNFEDANYYEYAEDDEGNEIYAHAVQIAISNAVSGGLIWDNNGATSDDLGYTGTPIDGNGKNFQLTNTSDKILKSAELLGDAEQTTYSGKNLANYLDVVKATNDTTLTFVDDGFRQVTTSTGYGTKLEIAGLATSTTYTISWSLAVTSGTANKVVRVFEGTSQSVAYGTYSQVPTGAGHLTFTTGASATSVNIWFYNGVPSAGDTTWTKIMLESGNQQTSYEPYVGGIASPNPDYPQAVNTVTGEQTVKIEGKNLFDNSFENFSRPVDYWISKPINLKQGETYTLKATLKSGATTMTQIVFGVVPYGEKYADFSGVMRNAINYGGGLQTRTFAIDSTWTSPKFVAYASSPTVLAELLDSYDIQLELGSTATTYEPYQGQEFEVNLGKNLFDISQATMANIYMNTNGWTSASNEWIGTNSYIAVEPNTTYTLSSSASSGTQVAINQYTSESRSAFISPRIDTATFTTSATARFISFSIKDPNATNFQLERGSSASSYTPYFSPIELAKIGTYQDRIYKNGGKWYVEKQVGKVVYDGSEAGWFAYSSNVYAGGARLTTIRESLCDYAVFMPNVTTAGALEDKKYCWASEGNDYRPLFRRNDIADLATWKTWLSTHPTTVYYALATPTTTEITNQALIDQLNSLQHANTYTDLTNFSTSSVYLNGFLSVKAYPKGGTPTGGYIWEAGGAGGPTTLTVDGVDNAYPIWTVPGPATNPTLTNITTGQTISWTGTVPNGQELVIDMANQTASLSGANVFEFVSGSWFTLEPGNNRVSYSAINATDPSKLEWNGVTG